MVYSIFQIKNSLSLTKCGNLILETSLIKWEREREYNCFEPTTSLNERTTVEPAQEGSAPYVNADGNCCFFPRHIQWN